MLNNNKKMKLMIIFIHRLVIQHHLQLHHVLVDKIVLVARRVVLDTLRKLLISLLFNEDFVLKRIIPLSTASVRQRRVIESIVLHVQRKYKYSNKDFI